MKEKEDRQKVEDSRMREVNDEKEKREKNEKLKQEAFKEEEEKIKDKFDIEMK